MAKTHRRVVASQIFRTISSSYLEQKTMHTGGWQGERRPAILRDNHYKEVGKQQEIEVAIVNQIAMTLTIWHSPRELVDEAAVLLPPQASA